MNLRPALLGDVEALTALSEELGYPSRVEDLRRRFEALDSTPGHALFVVEKAGKILGWIHVFISLRLESGPFAEIGGLVVAETHRRQGVGRRLCDQARRWAHQHGCEALRVRTRAERKAAHRFYERIGFRQAKTQLVLVTSSENS